MKKIHLVPLIAGVYAAILGVGLVRIGIFGSHDGISLFRLLGGLVIAGLGALGIWDGLRDLLRPKSEPDQPAPADQYIFTDEEGKRSTCTSAEELRARLEFIMTTGSKSKVSVHILPPRPVPGAGCLEQVLCIRGCSEKPLCLIAILQTENGAKSTCMKEADFDQAMECFQRLMDGGLEDFPSWTPVIVKQAAARPPINQTNQQLTLFYEERQEAHRFFTGRDVELAIDGLADGKYRRMELMFPSVAFHAFPSQEEDDITLRLILLQDKGARAFEKSGTATQVKFWLIDMLNNGLPEQLYGWKEIAVPKK